MIDASIMVAIFLFVGAIELLLRGRARLWARIFEVSVALGGVLFLLSLAGVALMPLGALWLLVTGGLVTLALLQPEVTT